MWTKPSVFAISLLPLHRIWQNQQISPNTEKRFHRMSFKFRHFRTAQHICCPKHCHLLLDTLQSYTFVAWYIDPHILIYISWYNINPNICLLERLSCPTSVCSSSQVPLSKVLRIEAQQPIINTFKLRLDFFQKFSQEAKRWEGGVAEVVRGRFRSCGLWGNYPSTTPPPPFSRSLSNLNVKQSNQLLADMTLIPSSSNFGS